MGSSGDRQISPETQRPHDIFKNMSKSASMEGNNYADCHLLPCLSVLFEPENLGCSVKLFLFRICNVFHMEKEILKIS